MRHKLEVSVIIIALISSIFMILYHFNASFYELTLEVNVVNLAKAQTSNSTATSVDTIIERADNLDNQKRYDEAIPYWQKVLAINSTNINALNSIANDLDNLKRYDEAIAYYDKVLAIDPNNRIALNSRANDLDILKNSR